VLQARGQDFFGGVEGCFIFSGVFHPLPQLAVVIDLYIANIKYEIEPK